MTATTGIDPRLRARRIEVMRSAGRRRLRRLMAMGAVLGALAVVWSLSLTPLLDVDAIRIEGATHTDRAAIEAALDIQRGDALLTADVGAAAEALASLPWVETAEVRRSWPGALSVEVVERVAVAAVAARGGGWVLVDRSGKQLEVVREPALDLARVAGRRLSPEPGALAGERFEGALHLATALTPSIGASVVAIWPQRDGSLEATVRLADGHEAAVRFGAPDQLEAKLLALGSILETTDPTGVRVIDVRVPSGPALTRG